jgi:general secretion pathway protein H
MPRNNPQRGFTLLEMVVTIAVMGLVLTLAAGMMQPHSSRLEMQLAAREIAQAMRTARAQAIAQGADVAFTVPRLPPGLVARLQAPRGGINFAPDGSASGGQVVLEGVGPDFVVVADWLTGRVDVSTRN